MKSKYKLEKNIPVPPRHKPWSRFPFAYMQVGESFFVTKKDEEATTILGLKSLLFAATARYKLDNDVTDKFSYIADRENDGVRVFRVK